MIIVDASVAIKWIDKNEEYSDIARLLYKRHIDGNEEVVVPRLLFYEVANALATKSRSSEETIRGDMAVLLKSNLSNYLEEDKELIEAAILAKEYKTSVYDMLYAVIAKNKKCSLVTADENFVKKTKFKHVKLLKELFSATS